MCVVYPEICLFPASRGKSIELEDVKFHQCVRLSRFENDRTISFIPPDGEFELMSYRLSQAVKPLVWVEAAVEHHRGSRVEYMVKCRAQFKRRSTANNVEIYVPVPDDADTPKFRVRLAPRSRNRSDQTYLGIHGFCSICSR
jgi:AP-1 complex subunit mu